MPVELKVPSVGESVTEVEISEWYKTEGDPVKRDEVLAIIETEKVTVELPAPGSGIITKIVKKKGETAKVGDVIGYMEVDEKRREQPEKELPATESQRETGEKLEREASKEAEKSQDTKDKDRADASEAARVMPAARRILAERGLKPQEVTATGPGGRLLKEDALRHAERVEESKIEQTVAREKSPTASNLRAPRRRNCPHESAAPPYRRQARRGPTNGGATDDIQRDRYVGGGGAAPAVS